MSLQQLTTVTQDIFNRYFGYAPAMTVQAPGRVNLIGEHTDYNDGFVLPCAIDYQTVISCAKRDDRKVRVIAADYDNQQDEFSLDAPFESHPTMMWSNYVRGVLKYLQIRNPNFGGADLVISGNVPQGAGLSSSASLEVAVGQAFQALYDLPLDGVQLALNGQEAENKFVGCNCGIMDQFASVFGKKGNLIRLDCRSLEYAYFPFDPKGYKLVLLDSRVKHELVGSPYNDRRASCERVAKMLGQEFLRGATMEQLDAIKDKISEEDYKRARYVIGEEKRVLDVCEALEKGDYETVGERMYETHWGMSKDYEVSCEELDFLATVAKECGVTGSRIMGGGFGGCTINLVKDELYDNFIATAKKRFNEKYGHEPKVYEVVISDGSRRLE